MLRRTRLLAVASFAVLAACTSSSSPPPSGPTSGGLVVSVSPASVVANGTNTVSVLVSGAANGAIWVSTNRGAFTNGQKAIQVSAAPASVTLVSCNESKDGNCVGSVAIRAVDASGLAGQALASFTSGGGPGPDCATCSSASCSGVVCDSLGHTCTATTPYTCTACPSGTTEICNDGIDNNCNGLIDCADPQCQPVGNALGQVCDSKGNTCSVAGATGTSTCTTCSGNGATPEAKETSCGDGIDNDCNGLVDCQDPNCASQPCAVGFVCDPSRKTCTVPSTTCTICGPAACVGLVCDSVGHTCANASPSTCTTCPGGATEICNDGKDNNCNGLIDCADSQCQPVGNALGQLCDAKGNTCSVKNAAGVSSCTTCSGNGGTAQPLGETSCGDGKDNDCNGLIDCQDPNCASQPCAFGYVCDGTAKTCSKKSSVCTACGEPACVGMICNVASGLVCSNGTPSTCSTCPAGTITCADSSAFSLVLTAASNRIPAIDTATTIITATLKMNGTALAGQAIAFSSVGAGTLSSSPPLTDANGQTTVVFTSSRAGGQAVITGSFVASSSTKIQGAATVDMPYLGQVALLSMQYDVLGARYSDFQERSTLLFELRDTTGLPYPAGLSVQFSHESLGHSYVGLSYEDNCLGKSRCLATATTDASGQAAVVLTSGTAAGTVSVDALATAGGIDKAAGAQQLAIVGAKASSAHITLNCFFGDDSITNEVANVKNVPAFSNSDCTYSHYVDSQGKNFTCKVHLADRFNNTIGRDTRVQFFTEAGTAGPSALTPLYDTKADPNSQQGLGIASSYVRPDGVLPANVVPFGGEFRMTYPDGCYNSVHNPRDGLVTIIAVVNGEDGFVDLDGDGDYKLGEPFITMGEPYIDANDNGVHDDGEFFIDVNGNGVYEGPTAVFKRDSVIWAETRVLFSGLPSRFVSPATTSSFAFAGFFDTSSSAVNSFAVKSTGPTSQTILAPFGDGNFNPPKVGAAFTFTLTGAGGATASVLADPTAYASPLGLSFTQMYCPQQNLVLVSNVNQCSSACASSPCYVVTNVGNCSAGTSPLPPAAADYQRYGCTGFGAVGQVRITGGLPNGSNNLTVTATPTGGSTVTATLPGTVAP